MLTFDAEARVVLPLTSAADLPAAPALAATRPATDYEAVFRLLRRQIDRDLIGLRMAGLRPLRPLVVFVSDGRPTRGYWPPAHAALTEPGWEGAADILAFGFGEASTLTLRRIGTAGAFLPSVRPETLRLDPGQRSGGRPGAPALVAPVMSFVLDVLGHPSTAGSSPSTSPFPEPGADGWRSLDQLVR